MFRGARNGSDHPPIDIAAKTGAGTRKRWAATARRTLGVSLAAIELVWAVAALAQVSPTPFPGQQEPGRSIPPPAPPPPSQFEFNIPSPRRGPVPRAVDEIEFDVSKINISGATAFPPEAFTALTDPLVGKKAKLSDIIGVADKIEAMYRAKGFVLTRAFVPPQTVANGVFQINVVEGYIKAASISGGDDATRQRVESFVAPVTEQKPAKIDTLERGLLLANDLPGTSASGVLRPSPTEPGASDLMVTVNQVPWDALVYSDNRGAAVTGPITLGTQLVANSLPKIGGQLMLDASGTPDFAQRRLFQTHYARPLGFDGLTMSLSGVLAHGVPAAAGGNLVSDSYALGARLAYPLVVSRPLRLGVEGGLTVQAAKVTLVSNAFCVFSDDHWRTVDAALTSQERGLIHDSTTGTSLGVTQGLPILGAESSAPCVAGAGASTGFTKLTGSVSHDQPISGPVSANIHGLAQYGLERLIVGEQTSFGGSGIGRGYDPASLAADSGIGIANELRYDMHFAEYHVDLAQFYVFVDYGRTWGRHDDSTSTSAGVPNRHSLASTGIGLRLTLLQRVTGGIEFAQQLIGVPNNDGGKTGARILFNAAISF